jgi:hypothetical protein
MELEHLFHTSGLFLALQLFFAGSLLVPGVMGRADLYHAFVRKLASAVVTFGPVGLLVYVLYEVSRLA